ncbi:MAG: hypothetical protein AB1758_29520 [Candidatus Eremiobacterota bacterium]
MMWTQPNTPALTDVLSRCRATLEEHVLNNNFLVSRQGDSFMLYSRGPLTQVFARMLEIVLEDVEDVTEHVNHDELALVG